jgi:hypothetical protein
MDYCQMSHTNADVFGGPRAATMGRVLGLTGSLQGRPIFTKHSSKRFTIPVRGVDLFHPTADDTRGGTPNIYDGRILKVWERAPSNRPNPVDAGALEEIAPTGEFP